MNGLDRDPLFVALTRPQMFAGVTYSFFVVNMVVTAELFLILHAFWVLAVALLVHGLGVIISLNEPRIIDLWVARVSLCPRVRNYSIWRCNSYRP